MMKTSGFTLLELMITISIVAIIMTLSTPSARDMIASADRKAAFNQTSSALSLARSEAVNRNTTVTFCASTDHETCSTDWSAGQIVFEDPNGDGVVANANDIIRVFKKLGTNTKLTRILRDGTADNGFVRYNEAAMLVSNDEASNFTICDDQGAPVAKAIIINGSGQVRIASDSDDSGVVEILTLSGANVVSADLTCTP